MPRRTFESDSYIAQHISQIADADVALEDVRGWLKAYPWLLLLDGLDEVPPSGNRSAVLQAITDFWDEAIPVNADVAMIVTSRPQGYHDDLDPQFVLKLELTHLDRFRALSYADRLALFRLPDPERRARVLDRLNAAADSPSTAALMISPLQVAILFQLVDQRGQAPTDRWSLFNEYLSTVMKREQEKPGPSGEIMRRWARNVQALVRRAGLLLQTLAEADGAASSHLSVEQLSDLVRDLLREEGHSETEAASIAEDLILATTDRLAFLEQRAESRYAFEVRSLQEYAAAAALMAGTEADIIRRLKAIAGYAHWQHVYRIAASKAFADPDAEIYRETVVGINRGLDATDIAARAVRLGAHVSLGLVDDGLATDQPIYRRQLVTHAIEISKLGRSSALDRLVDALAALGEGFTRSLLTETIHSGSKSQREAGWQLLFSLSDVALWARGLIDELRPTSDQGIVEAIASLESASAQYCLGQLTSSAQDIPVTLLHQALARRTQGRDPVGDLDFLRLLPGFDGVLSVTLPKAREVSLLPGKDRPVRLLLNTLEETDKTAWWSSQLARTWELTPLVGGFMANPSPGSLAAYAAGLSARACDEANHLSLPWILNTLAALGRDHDFEMLAQQAAAGGFGQPDDWAAAERRLLTEGVTQADLDLWSEGVFFDSRVATVGAPYFPSARRTNLAKQASWAQSLLDATIAAPEGQVREQLRFLLGLALVDGNLKQVSAQDLLLSLLSSTVRWLQPPWLQAVPVEQLELPALLERLRDFAREGRVSLGRKVELTPTEERLVELASELKDPDLLAIAVCSLAHMPERLHAAAFKLRDAAHRASATSIREVQSLAVPILISTDDMNTANALRDVFIEEKDSCGVHVIVNLAKSRKLNDNIRIEILANALDRVADLSPQLHLEMTDELNRILDARRSGLHERKTWQELNLPPSIYERLDLIRSGAPRMN